MLTSSNFGLQNYGAVLGALNICLSLGLSTGPLFSGFMYDATGSYTSAYIIFAGLLFVAVPIILLVRKPGTPLGA